MEERPNDLSRGGDHVMNPQFPFGQEQHNLDIEQNGMMQPERALVPDIISHSTTQGWVDMEPDVGGIPPSARSLHSSALLNVRLKCSTVVQTELLISQ